MDSWSLEEQRCLLRCSLEQSGPTLVGPHAHPFGPESSLEVAVIERPPCSCEQTSVEGLPVTGPRAPNGLSISQGYNLIRREIQRPCDRRSGTTVRCSEKPATWDAPRAVQSIFKERNGLVRDRPLRRGEARESSYTR